MSPCNLVDITSRYCQVTDQITALKQDLLSQRDRGYEMNCIRLLAISTICVVLVQVAVVVSRRIPVCFNRIVVLVLERNTLRRRSNRVRTSRITAVLLLASICMTATPLQTAVAAAPGQDEQIPVSFGDTKYEVMEGQSVEIAVGLDSAPSSSRTVTLTTSLSNGALTADFSLNTTTLTFDSVTISQTITFTAADDEDDDDGEIVTISWTELSGGLVDGVNVSAEVLIIDDDMPFDISEFDLTWTTPSQDSWGSMPIGNGDIGINVWVEENDNLQFIIGKTDAYDANATLLKLGKVNVEFDPNPFRSGYTTFSQHLDVGSGKIKITGTAPVAGGDPITVDLEVWVDANNPSIRVTGTSNTDVDVTVSFETWRTGNANRELTGRELPQMYKNEAESNTNTTVSFLRIFRERDTVVSGLPDRVIWYYRNTWSRFSWVNEFQNLSGWSGADPLLNRTFGAAILGAGMTRSSDTAIVANDITSVDVSIYPYTAQTADINTWRSGLQASIGAVTAKNAESRASAHVEWWDSFWKRHWIKVSSADSSETVATNQISQNYALIRAMLAGSARGFDAMHFNGSIFNVNMARELPHRFISTNEWRNARYDADYRTWGSAHWFQNIRFGYWPMLMSGDFDMMHSLFDMFIDALPFAQYRTQQYYNHGGAYFTETMTFWGAALPTDYGTLANRRTAGAGDDLGFTFNAHKRYHWEGVIELSVMMLDYFLMTQDSEWLKTKGLPFIDEVLKFFYEHYPPVDGLMEISPSQALETVRPGRVDGVIKNPTDKVSGLHFLLDGLLDLRYEYTTEAQRLYWFNMKSALPPLSLTTASGDEVIASTESHRRHSYNKENPDLYATFPFRLYGVGRPDLELAQNTFNRRLGTDVGGWNQQPIHATMVGRTSQAKNFVGRYFREKEMLHTISDTAFRYPTMYGPSHDWIPNIPQAGNAMIALQRMLVQSDGRRIIMFPTWPSDWDAQFKVSLPYNTTVEGILVNGQITKFVVQPSSRALDVDWINFEPAQEDAPDVTVTSPGDGGIFDWGKTVPFSVTVTDRDSTGTAVSANCADVTVYAYLVRDDQRSVQSTQSGCNGSVSVVAAPSDSATADLRYELEASYTDADSLTDTNKVTLQPKRKQAEHYSSQNGIVTEPGGDGLNIAGVQNGDYFVFSPVDLTGVTSISARVANARNTGASFEVRLDSATGTLLASISVPVTGGWHNWQTHTSESITAPTGTHSLYFVGTTTSDGVGNVDWIEFNFEPAREEPPDVTVTSPGDGGIFDWGKTVPFSVTVTDRDSTGTAVSANCADVTVYAYLVRDDQRSVQSTQSGCNGSVSVVAAPSDSATADLRYELEASYTDADSLTDTNKVTLQPKRKQAEHYSSQNGIVTEPGGDGLNIAGVQNGDYFVFSPVDLTGVTSISARVANARNTGASFEVRLDSAAGTLLASISVPVTGGWHNWQTHTSESITAPTGTHSLYFVGTTTSDGVGNVDWIEFNGGGVFTD